MDFGLDLCVYWSKLFDLTRTDDLSNVLNRLVNRTSARRLTRTFLKTGVLTAHETKDEFK